VAPTVANGLAQLWLGATRREDTLQATLKTHIVDERSCNSIRRQFDEISERLAEGLTPLVRMSPLSPTLENITSVSTVVSSVIQDTPFNASVATGRKLMGELIRAFRTTFQDQTPAVHEPAIYETCSTILTSLAEDMADVLIAMPKRSMAAQEDVSDGVGALLSSAYRPINSVRELRVDALRRHADSGSGAFEADYRSAVARRYSRLQLVGVETERVTREYQLSIAYIHLTLGLRQEFVSVPEAMASSPRLFVRGEAGSG